MTDDEIALIALKYTPDQLLDKLGWETLELVYALKDYIDERKEEFSEDLQGEGDSFSPW